VVAAARRTQDPVDHHDTLVAPARERPPVLGRYRLLERLGAGGFGVVWRAHDELLRREVAVKRISLPTAEDRERATREAQAAARLSHPAIVALYEACTDEDAFYLISELVHGETLAQLIASDALCDEQILEVGLALCDALAHAHQRGVIHRDVKPQNVLLPHSPAERNSSPRVAVAAAKLTDFGGAQLAGEEALTRTGDVLGTLAYMAPEQSEGHEAGEAADLYSLALVLYEALSGVNPVRGPTPAATVRRIGSDLPSLRRHRRELPRQLTRALDAALSPEPEDRGTLAELRDALETGLEDIAGRPARRSPLQSPPTPAPAASGRAYCYLDGTELVDTFPAPDASGGGRFALPADARSSPSDRRSVPTEQPEHPRIDTAGWLTLTRCCWLIAALAGCAWQVGAARPGVALFVLCAVLPLVLLVRRPGPRWLAAALAPVLGLAGLAGVFPAAAGQVAHWPSRALLGALGYWWLVLAGPLLDRPGRRLWLGPVPGTAAGPGRLLAWERSLGAAGHTLIPLLSLGLLLGAALWAAAAALLPWLVRGRSALADALAGTLWAVALAAASPLLDGGLAGGAGEPSPRGALLGAGLGAVLALAARALRGPV
jgi:eukaryotic-like serine/threonine-protein kinase